jgi:hypothetical protein
MKCRDSCLQDPISKWVSKQISKLSLLVGQSFDCFETNYPGGQMIKEMLLLKSSQSYAYCTVSYLKETGKKVIISNGAVIDQNKTYHSTEK